MPSINHSESEQPDEYEWERQESTRHDDENPPEGGNRGAQSQRTSSSALHCYPRERNSGNRRSEGGHGGGESRRRFPTRDVSGEKRPHRYRSAESDPRENLPGDERAPNPANLYLH